jgi:hypothetical protein
MSEARSKTAKAAAAQAPDAPYEELSLSELRAVAAGRDVAINLDVEKAERVRLLRAADRSPADDPDKRPGDADRAVAEAAPPPEYDALSVEDLRGLCDGRGLALPADFERAHLVTELHAADTHTR